MSTPKERWDQAFDHLSPEEMAEFMALIQEGTRKPYRGLRLIRRGIVNFAIRPLITPSRFRPWRIAAAVFSLAALMAFLIAFPAFVSQMMALTEFINAAAISMSIAVGISYWVVRRIRRDVPLDEGIYRVYATTNLIAIPLIYILVLVMRQPLNIPIVIVALLCIALLVETSLVIVSARLFIHLTKDVLMFSPGK